MKSQELHKPSQLTSAFVSPLQQFLDSQSRIESKLDELLAYLKGTSVEQGAPSLQEAIRAHLHNGDRTLIDNYMKDKAGKH